MNSVAEPKPGLSRLRGRSIAGAREYGVVIALVLLFIVLSIASEPFLTKTNLLNILSQWSIEGVMAVGLTLLLISGGFDLSMGAVYALAGVVAAKFANDHGVAVGLIAGCLAGLAVGVINGIIVNVLRINPFVTTLATSIMIGGVSLAITGGLVIPVHAESFASLGRDKIFGVEDTVWIFLIAVVVTALLLHRTTFGRQLYAIGGNPEAARLCGVRVRMISTLAFALCGMVAGIAGVLAASRISSGQAETGGYELIFDVFAAVVIGGTSIAGGVGAIWRTVVGLLLLAMIGNGFNLLAISDVYQRIAFGGLIIIAVAIDIWTSQTRS